MVSLLKVFSCLASARGVPLPSEVALHIGDRCNGYLVSLAPFCPLGMVSTRSLAHFLKLAFHRAF